MNSIPQRIAVSPLQGVAVPIRLCFLVFVFTVPFDGLDLFNVGNIFTFTKAVGLFFGMICLLQPTVCFAKPPAAFWFFAIYAGVYFLQDVIRTGGRPLDSGYVLTLWQDLILLWISFNLLRHSPKIENAFLATMAVALGIIMTLMRFGIATRESVSVSGTLRVGGVGMSDFVYAVGVWMGIGLLFDKRIAFVWRLSVIPFLCLFAYGCIHSGSRGSVLAIATSALVYGLAARGIGRKMKYLMLMAAFLAGFVYLILNTDVARERWRVGLEEGRWASHDIIFYMTVDMFIEKPLFGWGPINNLQELAAREGGLKPLLDTHNDILWALTATGLAGGIFYIAGVGMCVLAGWKSRGGTKGPLALALVTAFLIFGSITTTHKRKSAWLVMSYALAAPYMSGVVSSKATAFPRRNSFANICDEETHS